ncbi:hypothetical protein [Promicromonospora sp. NPDC050880]|uniref:hypothetical protein n=1 Tax=Promicromonospora sp. NPDC050880 TaxID=3364406 RepID=UPI00378A342D
MNLTRTARSPLAAPRRGFASDLTVMFLVLALLAVQAVCGVHLDEADHGRTQPHGTVELQAPVAPAADQAAHADSERPGGDPNQCAEDRTLTARYDRTLSPSMVLVGAQSLALQWLVPDISHHGPQAPSGLAGAAAPSLHALGISRT